MKKMLWFMLLTCFLSTGGMKVWANDSAPATEETAGTEMATVQEGAKKYFCPMHPEVQSDEPGKCPECGMDLVEQVEETTSTDTHTDTAVEEETM